MPPTTPADNGTAKTYLACKLYGSGTGIEHLDATNLNALAETLRTRLSSDLFGNFHIQGSKAGGDTRHGQLQDVISLVNKIEEFRTTMDKYIAMHTPKEAVVAEKPINLNKKWKEVIDRAVEEQVDARLRDLALRVDRLDVEVKQSQKKGTSGALKSKCVESDDIATRQALDKVDRRVDGVMRTQKERRDVEERRAETTRSQGERIHELEYAVSRLEGIDRRLDGLDSFRNDVFTDLTKLFDKVF